MNMNQKRAALKAINPTVDTTDSIAKRVLQSTAGMVGVVPSYAVGFFADIGASFQYEEAKRKGQLEAPVVETAKAAKPRKSGLL